MIIRLIIQLLLFLHPACDKTQDMENKLGHIYNELSGGTYDMAAVIGPTASGKTAFAVSLARFLSEKGMKAEIISADSRQVYKGMDIGTGKDISEYSEGGAFVPYHLIDIAEAGEKYNLFRYQADFIKTYADLKRRGVFPILCGGSGLYIEAVTKKYALPEVDPDYELRSTLEKKDMDELVSMLAGMKKLHNTTDIDNKKRVIRAIEIAKYFEDHGIDPYNPQTGNELPSDTKFIGIFVDRDERNRRIDMRLEKRLGEGLVEEVRALLDRGIPPEDLIYYGLEYKFVTLYLTGELSYEQMRERLAIAIHQFAKRQMTWFRGMERRGINIEWI